MFIIKRKYNLSLYFFRLFIFIVFCSGQVILLGNECNSIVIKTTSQQCRCISFLAVQNGHSYCNVTWDLGDGYQFTQAGVYTYTHCYAQPGYYSVSIYVDCPGGDCATAITVYAPPDNINANFDYDSYCEDSCTQFTNLSTGDYNDLIWGFGNGASSTDSNPCHPYSSAGFYDLQLIVFDTSGCADTINQLINVVDSPTAAYTLPDTVCLSDTFAFFDISTSPTSVISDWFWDFGDNTGTSLQQNPSYAYNAFGKFSIMLMVTDTNACVDTVFDTLRVLNMPNADFNFLSLCEDSCTQFNKIYNGDQSFISWDFGDGSGSFDIAPCHVYTAPGLYNVILNIENTPLCSAF
ncbi:MAG TPA: hypothetical protein EYQ86_00250 [Bacteroidetes bacterium]|nr:hypothetical protein [Bacteroidota bacterium]